jgi:hypothetical protein
VDKTKVDWRLSRWKIWTLFTNVGNSVFFLYGGIESDAKTGNVAPNNDIYIMRMGPRKYSLQFHSLSWLGPAQVAYSQKTQIFNFTLDFQKSRIFLKIDTSSQNTYILSRHVDFLWKIEVYFKKLG